MIDFSLVNPLWELRDRTLRMMEATAADGDTIERAGARAIIAIDEAASDRSPFLTGTLAAAHLVESELVEDDGRFTMYIDPNAVNPIFGGKPSEYGVEVHGRKPWLAETVEEDAPEIMDLFVLDVIHGWDEIWL